MIEEHEYIPIISSCVTKTRPHAPDPEALELLIESDEGGAEVKVRIGDELCINLPYDNLQDARNAFNTYLERFRQGDYKIKMYVNEAVDLKVGQFML